VIDTGRQLFTFHRRQFVSVLIAYASALPSTAETAQRIADRLLKSGVAAIVRPIDRVASIRQHRAVVVGCALRAQEWLPEATAFLHGFRDELRKVPVWLFSTVESTEFDWRARQLLPAARLQESSAVAYARGAMQIRDHRQFACTHTRAKWTHLRQLFWKVCGGSAEDPEGDREVDEWATGIARQLQAIDHAQERRRLHLSVRGRP
jgi:menaquinone-dependent protoporphyrinogen oxidase